MGLGNPYLFPPFGWQGFVKDSERGSCLHVLDSTGLANTSLVPAITLNVSRPSSVASRLQRPASEPRPQSTSPSVGRESTPDHLACLRQLYEMQGISQRAANLIISSWYGNTNSAYNAAWQKWYSWCAQQGADPLSTSVVNIMQFSTDQFDTGLHYHTVNTLRSARRETSLGTAVLVESLWAQHSFLSIGVYYLWAKAVPVQKWSWKYHKNSYMNAFYKPCLFLSHTSNKTW